MTKIKRTKYFHRHINGVSSYGRVVIAMKIKPGENLTDEIFYRQKIPGTSLAASVSIAIAQHVCIGDQYYRTHSI